MQKTPQKHKVFTEFSEGWPSGLEPPTSGSTIRRRIIQSNEIATSCEAAFAPWQFWWQSFTGKRTRRSGRRVGFESGGVAADQGGFVLGRAGDDCFAAVVGC